MTKEEMLTRLFAIGSALCNARADMESLANDCHDAWIDAKTEEEGDFWGYCECAIQDKADPIAEVEEWIFNIKEGCTTIEEVVAEEKQKGEWA